MRGEGGGRVRPYCTKDMKYLEGYTTCHKENPPKGDCAKLVGFYRSHRTKKNRKL